MHPLVVPALTAAVGVFGAERANRVNQREAAKNRAFQSKEAAVNRQFQERMRNTEWQAAVADMTAAGINPALAYSQGGASSPSGSMAGGATAAPAENSVSSALQALAMRKNLQLLDAQIAKTGAEASSAAADASIKFRDQQLANQKYSFYFDESGMPRQALKDLLSAEHLSSMASSARSVSDAELSALSIPERKAVAAMFDTLGASPKMLQIAMPFILQLMRGPTR